MRAASAESSIVIESDLYRVEISNRGARGAQLAAQEIHRRSQTAAHARSGPSPMPRSSPAAGRFRLRWTIRSRNRPSITRCLKSPRQATSPTPGAVLHAPAEITLSWSDGHLEVTKHLKFNESYIVEVKTSATLGWQCRCEPASAGPADLATSPRIARPLQTQVFTSAAGKLNTLAAKNLGKSGQTTVRAPVAGTFDFAGIEDLYFAAAFLPPFTAHGDLAETPLTLTGWTYSARNHMSDGKTETEIVPANGRGNCRAGPAGSARVRRPQEHRWSEGRAPAAEQPGAIRLVGIHRRASVLLAALAAPLRAATTAGPSC